MRILSLLLIVPLFISCTSQNESNRNAPESQNDLAEFADSLFQVHVDSSHIAGASVIVYKGGDRLLDKSYGYASLELEVPMPENASFEIGSVTKQFTGAAILKLEEEGKLSLQDDITEYLDFDTQGRDITINQLLNHTSGIASYTEIPDFWAMSVHTYDRDTMFSVVEKNGYLFEPGESLIYNNSAYFFLGLIIEKVSGKTYEEYLDEVFFTPLAMENTYYCSTSKIVKNKAYGYSQSENGLIQKAYLDHTWPYAAGSLCSTSEDLLTWMTALHGGKVLSDESYKKLISPQTLNDGTPIRYAMGVAHFNDFGNEVIRHGGGINGFLSETKYYPEEDLYVICLVNTTGPQGAGFFAEELTWQLMEKKDYPTMEMEADLIHLSGNYGGQVRGRKMTVEIKITEDGLIILPEGEDEADTVTAYIGNNTWMDGNDIITLKEDEVTIDQIYGFYRMNKME